MIGSLDKSFEGTPKTVRERSVDQGQTNNKVSRMFAGTQEKYVACKKMVYPIEKGDYSYLELIPVGTLEVKLVQANDLSNKDLVGKLDPFAKLFVRPLREKTKTSKTLNNQLNPIWNELIEFLVEDANTHHLTVRIFDDEGVQASELIGYAQVPLKDLEPGKVKNVWLKMVKDLEIQ